VSGYSKEVDWWALGAIMFEVRAANSRAAIPCSDALQCLVGFPPFCSESAHDTYRKILDWQTWLQIPDDVHLSRESEDMVRRMITNADSRLGRNSSDEIKVRAVASACGQR
jgi:protein-serine/threonine kinase